MLQWRESVTRVLERLGHFLAGVAVAGMLSVTVADVVGRWLFKTGVPGVIDIVELCLIWATMLGVALAWSQRAHIVVDIVDMLAPWRLVLLLDMLARIAVAVAMAALVWLAVDEFRNAAEFGDSTTDIGIPLVWFWAAVLVGYGLSVLLVLVAPPLRGADAAHG
jgi:TRAP-type C4-dicarboxylate transport system permease small subunit